MSIILNSSDTNATPSGGSAKDADLIKDGNLETFGKDVIEQSVEVPVVVDFWAPWCGPCKTLTPIIEKITREADGQVKLIKIDIDQNPEIAQQLRIQSVPTVYAFKGGRPVDGFQGALPESEVRGFFEKLIGGPITSPVATLLENAALAIADEDYATAYGFYGDVLARESENDKALGGIIRCLIGLGELESARQYVEDMPNAEKAKAPIAEAISALELAESGFSSDQIDMAKARIDANPDDLEAWFEYGMACFAGNKRDEAVNAMITIIRKDRTWNEQAGRLQLLKFFDAWGPMDAASVAGRRALSTVLFS